jgi:hypothetical protein
VSFCTRLKVCLIFITRLKVSLIIGSIFYLKESLNTALKSFDLMIKVASTKFFMRSKVEKELSKQYLDFWSSEKIRTDNYDH